MKTGVFDDAAALFAHQSRDEVVEVSGGPSPQVLRFGEDAIRCDFDDGGAASDLLQTTVWAARFANTGFVVGATACACAGSFFGGGISEKLFVFEFWQEHVEEACSRS